MVERPHQLELGRTGQCPTDGGADRSRPLRAQSGWIRCADDVRYLCEPGLGEVLSPLAREELEHFEQVLALIKARGRYLEPLPSPGYGAELAKHIRKVEPLRMLDSFLVAGLIEARSHERMALLAEHSPDSELRSLYADLLASEARHFGLYWTLAESRWPRDVVTDRLSDLAAFEAAALEGTLANPEDVRIHSVGITR